MTYLESRGYNIHILNQFKDNVYLMAVKSSNNIRILKYLESRGLNIHKTNSNSENAILFACGLGHIKIIKYLKSRGLNLNKKNINGNGIYLYAKRNMKYYNNIKKLLKNFSFSNSYYILYI